jgi:hypothetical protein
MDAKQDYQLTDTFIEIISKNRIHYYKYHAVS